MSKRFWALTIVFLLIVSCTTVGFYLQSKQVSEDKDRTEDILTVNEISKLLEEGREEEASAKLKVLNKELSEKKPENKGDIRILLIGGISMMVILIASISVYVTVLRPLLKIKKYTGEIAKGNLDIPLELDRASAVSEFSWAIDSMRKEIKKARSAEAEAVESNKTVIATLSHDIKTPIASIRAYAEGLGANLDSTPEKRAKYVDVIMKKSDEVSKVTDDLLLHSLSDMRRLHVEPKDMEITSFTRTAIKDLDPEGHEVILQEPDFEATVYADRDRLLQCLENLITNSRKYGKAPIEVVLFENEEKVEIHVQDHGEGIPDEDIPFIFDKFYRGHNHGDKPGSGLGLYIVKYLMEQMDGSVKVQNSNGGLLAILELPKKEQGKNLVKDFLRTSGG